MDSPLIEADERDGGQSVANGGTCHKLSREEEEYLDKLLAEKRIVDATQGLDSTQKLINSGRLQPSFLSFLLLLSASCTLRGSILLVWGQYLHY